MGGSGYGWGSLVSGSLRCGQRLPENLQHSLRIGADDFDEGGAFGEGLEGGLDLGAVGVAFDVDEEDVVPQAGAAGAAFELGHGDAVLGEGLEQAVYGAGAVGGGNDKGGFVAAGWLGVVVAEDEETGGVVGLVFDVGGEFG